MILVAFTNYDDAHMAPAKLFTWVGIENFISLFTQQGKKNKNQKQNTEIDKQEELPSHDEVDEKRD